jgi:hypothetical protein
MFVKVNRIGRDVNLNAPLTLTTPYLGDINPNVAFTLTAVH